MSYEEYVKQALRANSGNDRWQEEKSYAPNHFFFTSPSIFFFLENFTLRQNIQLKIEIDTRQCT